MSERLDPWGIEGLLAGQDSINPAVHEQTLAAEPEQTESGVVYEVAGRPLFRDQVTVHVTPARILTDPTPETPHARLSYQGPDLNLQVSGDPELVSRALESLAQGKSETSQPDHAMAATTETPRRAARNERRGGVRVSIKGAAFLLAAAVLPSMAYREAGGHGQFYSPHHLKQAVHFAETIIPGIKK